MTAFRFAALAMATIVLATIVPATTADAQSRRSRSEGEQPAAQSQPNRDKQFPVPSSWRLLSLNNRPYTGIDRPSFSLDQQYRAKGFGGCNTFSATAYPLREQRFAVGPLALTKKQCEKGLMESEHAFFVALRTAMQWDLEGTVLVIKGQNGELRFERSI